MKRDMDLIRKILITLEADPQPYFSRTLEIEGYTNEEINFHLMLLNEVGLIEGTDMSAGSEPLFFPERLTWSGFEFLESVKNETVWNEIKKRMSKLGGFVFELAKPLAIEIAKQYLTPGG
jgi:hypothetical protein